MRSLRVHPLVLLGLALGSSGAWADQTSSPTCPTSPAEWRAWRERVVGSLSNGWWGSVGSIAEREISLLDVCRTAPGQAEIFASASFQSCMAPLARFGRVAFLRNNPGGRSTLGFERTDAEYFRNERLEFPEMRELPAPLRDPALLSELSRADLPRERLSEIVTRLRREIPGARMLEFTSRTLTTPDSAAVYGRLLIYVPGQNYDQWIQFGLNHGQSNPTAPLRNVSQVTVQTRNRAGAQLQPPVVFFNDHFRVGQDASRLSSRLAELGRVENCYDCHKTGVNVIVPREDGTRPPGSFGEIGPNGQPVSGEQLVSELNTFIARYRGPRVESVDMDAYGPSLGPVRERSLEFIQRCSGLSDTMSLMRISQAMNCASCHNGRTLGAINFPMGLDHSSPNSFFRSMLISKHMPPGSQLAYHEADALGRCLTREYYGDGVEMGDLQRSLLANDCPGSTGEQVCRVDPALSGGASRVDSARPSSGAVDELSTALAATPGRGARGRRPVCEPWPLSGLITDLPIDVPASSSATTPAAGAAISP